MSLLIAILSILFFALVLLLVILNQGTLELHLPFRTYQRVPISVVMVGSLLAGVAFTSLISLMDGIRMRVQNRKLRKQVGRLEDEIERVRREPALKEPAPAALTRRPGDYPPPS